MCEEVLWAMSRDGNIISIHVSLAHSFLWPYLTAKEVGKCSQTVGLDKEQRFVEHRGRLTAGDELSDIITLYSNIFPI